MPLSGRGRTSQLRCSMSRVRAESGTDNTTMKRRQSRISPVGITEEPGTSHVRRQPAPLAKIHSNSGGAGSHAHPAARPGTAVRKTAMAAAIAVSTEPIMAIPTSGEPIIRCSTAGRFAAEASPPAISAIATSQTATSRHGDHRRLTGFKSAASAPISRSCEIAFSLICGAAGQSPAQIGERPVQVDLERDGSAAGRGGGLGQRLLVETQPLDRLPLRRRKIGNRRA